MCLFSGIFTEASHSHVTYMSFQYNLMIQYLHALWNDHNKSKNFPHHSITVLFFVVGPYLVVLRNYSGVTISSSQKAVGF